MKKVALAVAMSLAFAVVAYPQDKPARPPDGQVIRIGTQLVQLDAEVLDKNGKVVKGLNKEDFELYDEGKKQHITFFQYVDARNQLTGKNGDNAAGSSPVAHQGPGAADINRIFAFVVDDFMINPADMVYVRQMLTHFVDEQMAAGDLVAIVRTIGGKGLLQGFTTDPAILRRSIASLSASTNGLNPFENSGGPFGGREVRTLTSTATAGFVINRMKRLPGRKSMVLISGGIQVLAGETYLLNELADKATRAGVVINTIDPGGLRGGVAGFENTPAGPGTNPRFRNVAYGSVIGYNISSPQMGLREISAMTGGVAVLNHNDLTVGLDRILDASAGYYLLGYTPEDANFKNNFRKISIKVAGGYRVYARTGYQAREDVAPAPAVTRRDQLLAAIESPFARKEVGLDAFLLYKADGPRKGVVGVNMVIDPRQLSFEEADGKQSTSVDLDGFVFDEYGRLRGGFSQTLNPQLTAEEMRREAVEGLTYSESASLPAGVYQIRIAVRDSKSGALGTVARYLEIPDLSKGHLTASSIMLGPAKAGDVKLADIVPLSSNQRLSRSNDLRYALYVYNAKVHDGKSEVRSHVIIKMGEQVIYDGGEQVIPAPPAGSATRHEEVIKVGQLGLSKVKPGRYVLSITVTDPLAGKNGQTLARNAEFEVVD